MIEDEENKTLDPQDFNYEERQREEEWKLYKKERRSRLKNTEFSIIASNCCGTIMYYDLDLPYRSPTIDLSIEMGDFVKLAGNLQWYMSQKLTELKGEGKYPEGLLGDVKIRFVHYKTFEEGVAKWEERKERINWNNLFFVGVEKDGCTYEIIEQFERLPYKNKVIFTRREYPEFSSSYYIKGFEEKEELGVITYFKNQPLMRRYLDDFDYVTFLNRE